MVQQIEAATAAPARIPKVQKPTKPDRKARDAAVDSKINEINLLKSRISEIKAEIEEYRRSRNPPELVEAKNKLTVLQGRFSEAVDEKRRIRTELADSDRIRDQCITGTKYKFPFRKVEYLDNEIKKLEHRRTHTSISLSEERSLLQEISALNKNRELLEARAEIIVRLRQEDEVIDALKEEIDAQKELTNRLRENTRTSVDLDSLNMERDNAYMRIKELTQEVKEIKAKYIEKMETFHAKHQEWYQEEEQKNREEYRQRQEARDAREKEMVEEKYASQLYTIDQLVSYLHKLLPSSPEKVFAAPEGYVMKKKTRSEELEGWFAGSGKVNKGKRGKAPVADKAKEKLTLSVDTLSSLAFVKVAAPVTVSDVPKAIEELKGRKAYYEKLRVEGRDEEDEKPRAAATGKGKGQEIKKVVINWDSFESFPTLTRGTPRTEASSSSASMSESGDSSGIVESNGDAPGVNGDSPVVAESSADSIESNGHMSTAVAPDGDSAESNGDSSGIVESVGDSSGIVESVGDSSGIVESVGDSSGIVESVGDSPGDQKVV